MIKILEKHIADKIAAGEVVDRPVSIIKELVENSIDADATNITVEIKEGGKSYIRVTDNGCGIESGDVEIAFKRHATSKINIVDDLDAINTLGFRGEALASIAAVARVELITRTIDSNVGRKLVIEGSETIENVGTGCPEGTTITVRDLFYNVPARRKFMNSDNAEARRITEMISRIALAYSDIKFNMINGKKRVFSTQGKNNIFNSIVSIYGSEIARDLIPLEASRDGFHLKGFISAPSATMPSRNKEIFCVNGRVISSNIIQEALEAGYKEKLFDGRFPIAFMFLAMPPNKLDVNIHPTKKEIRFDDEHEVRDFITESVKLALATLNAIPKVHSESIKQVREANRLMNQDSLDLETGEKTKANADKNSHNNVPSEYVMESVSTYTPEPEIAQKSKVKIDDGTQVNIKNVLQSMRKQRDLVIETENQVANEMEGQIKDDIVNKPFDFNSLEVIGSIFNTYILATCDDSFYMIDQHAAHERVFYEKLMNEYNSAEPCSQQLIVPLSVGASASAVNTDSEWLPLLNRAGYTVEFFGNNTYLVREVPAFMSLDEAESFIHDMLDEFAEKPDLKNQKIIDKLITKSCKSAVKGGDVLDSMEVNALINQLKACNNPFSCPHGRPTFVRITRYEIEKMFKRV